jgi:hypothetical protein
VRLITREFRTRGRRFEVTYMGKLAPEFKSREIESEDLEQGTSAISSNQLPPPPTTPPLPPSSSLFPLRSYGNRKISRSQRKTLRQLANLRVHFTRTRVNILVHPLPLYLWIHQTTSFPFCFQSNSNPVRLFLHLV